LIAVEGERVHQSSKADALVPIDEGMVLDEAEAERGGDGTQRGRWIIRSFIFRTQDSRLQEACVAQAMGTAIHIYEVCLNSPDDRYVKEDETHVSYFASSR
jgi:hypothetical protein